MVESRYCQILDGYIAVSEYDAMGGGLVVKTRHREIVMVYQGIRVECPKFWIILRLEL